MHLRFTALNSFLLIFARIFGRILVICSAFVVYFFQLIALGLGQKLLASSLLALGARLVVRGMGVRVLILDEANSLVKKNQRPIVYLYNHQNPLDVFVIQGYLRIPSLTTAGLHLSRIFPWFALSALNSGHVLMDHMDSFSRSSAMRRSSDVIRRYGKIIIAPNGSLKTSIFQRVSASAMVLAKKHQALIIPWFFFYSNLKISDKDFYDPFALLIKRLAAPPAKIECRVGLSTDLDLPADTRDREGFTRAVQSYYREQQESG